VAVTRHHFGLVNSFPLGYAAMAESLAIIGLVSAIAQFVDLSTKIIQRLTEFQSSLDEAPQTFRDLIVQLPLLRQTLKSTKAHAETGIIDVVTQKAVLEVVEACQTQVQRLDDILVKTLPATGDTRLRRGVKAFKSVSQERDVQQIVGRIQQYQISLIHHQTSPATLALPVRRKAMFTVPFERDPRFTGQQDQMNDIDKLFKRRGRVALAGLGGVGCVILAAMSYDFSIFKSRIPRPQSKLMFILHLGNRKLPSSIAIDIERSIHKARLFGYTPAILKGSIKHIKRLQEPLSCPGGKTQRQTSLSS
jgi:hypothetical protein